MRRLALAALCLAAGCARTAPTVRPDAPPAPVEAPAPEAPRPSAQQAPAPPSPKASEPEFAPLARRPVVDPENRFTGEVEAAGELAFERSKGLTQFNIPLGTEAMMMCFVYDEEINAGSALRTMTRAIGEGLDLQGLKLTDIVEVAGVPTVFYHIDYLTRPGDGPVVRGLVKLMVHVSHETSLLCAHDEPGYAESFRRVTTALAASLQRPGQPKTPPDFVEIQVARLNGQLAGFEWREVMASGGMHRTALQSAVILPRSTTELVVDDSFTRETTDARGQLVEFRYVKVRDGKMLMELSAHRDAQGTYRYEGEHQGKPQRGTLAVKRGLVGELGISAAVRERLLSGKEGELRLDTYRPLHSLTGPTEMVVRKDGAGPRDVTLALGKNAPMKASVDARGRVERAELVLEGGLHMSAERIFVRGTPP